MSQVSDESKLAKTSMPISTLLLSVLDEMHEGLQVISKDWHYLYVNDVVAKQGKRKKDELIGKTMMECYPGIDKTPFFEKMRHCIETKKDAKFENEFIYPDGSIGWFQLYIHPVSEGVLILSIDISEKKQAELQLQEKIVDIEKLSNITINREIHISKLKKEISNLKELAEKAHT